MGGTGMLGEFGDLGELVGRAAAPAAAVAVAAWAAGVVTDRRRKRRTRKRMAGLLEPGWARVRRRRSTAPAWLRSWSVPFVVAVAGWALVGGVAGCLVGAAAAWALRTWRARRPARAPEETDAVRQLPLAADLLAACASAGAGPGEAAEAVGRSLGGPVGERLVRTAAELRLGGEPADVWRRFGALAGAEGLARCLERSGSSGAPAAEAVSRHAAGLRAERARRAAARAQRAQVLITAPVGLCFLPAFLAVGVAPVVIGLAGGLLHG
ncbi:type II secretion system F family protein [Streptomyces sp. MS191]|uniref:type II secretion system F family protein n=1 Tax=Streptomyces sp. ms191 TaxID=1827978 RepID=UPI0021C6FA96|nr:type II secretion system F family protein [Streptomyces sp. ms191]